MADGSVTYQVKVDDTQAQAELNRLQSKIKSLEDTLAKQGRKKGFLEERLSDIKAQYDAAVGAGTDDARTEALAHQYDKIAASIQNVNQQMELTKVEIDAAKDKAGQLSQALVDTGKAGQEGGEAAASGFSKLEKRIVGLVKRVFIFSVITRALRGLKSWLSETVKGNDEAAAAIANLKGALLTLAQPILNVIIPAFVALVNIITKVIAAIAMLVSKLFGTSIGASAESAKNLNAEKEALEGVGGAAKDASKSMASFDEINQLQNNEAGGGGGGGGAATAKPAFDFDMDEEKLQRIADLVIVIGAALLAWRIGTALGGGLTMMFGLFVAILGVVTFISGFFDAWQNGVNFDNLIKMVGGLAVAAIGLYIALGPVAAGIALIVGGVAMLVVGIKDVMENGLNLKNGLLIIAGIIATGLGIAILTVSLIPALIAGIVALILAVTMIGGTFDQVFGGVKTILQGFIDFFTGVFTGDWEKAWNGLKEIFTGVINVVLGIFGGVVNTIIRGLNWLIGKMNSISFDVPDWVPGIGGKTLGVNIPTIPEWQVPALAEGAVIPPNREFLALLGDQKNGTNIEAPLSTIVDAFRRVMQEQGGRPTTVVLQLDRRELGRAVVDVSAQENQRVGIKLGGA